MESSVERRRVVRWQLDELGEERRPLRARRFCPLPIKGEYSSIGFSSSKEDVMSKMRNLVFGSAMAAAVLVILTFATWASADIIDDWKKVEPPPVPELKAVTLNAASMKSATAPLAVRTRAGMRVS